MVVVTLKVSLRSSSEKVLGIITKILVNSSSSTSLCLVEDRDWAINTWKARQRFSQKIEFDIRLVYRKIHNKNNNYVWMNEWMSMLWCQYRGTNKCKTRVRWFVDYKTQSEATTLDLISPPAQQHLTLMGFVPSTRTFPCISSIAIQACEDLANLT